jgi:hypothetical protein
MATGEPGVPLRPLAPGDVVAGFCEALGEWVAAKVTELDPDWKTAGVLDLGWSGPEPSSVSDLGQAVALRLTKNARTQAPSFRAGLVRAPLLIHLLADDRERCAAAGRGEVAGRPEPAVHRRPVHPVREVRIYRPIAVIPAGRSSPAHCSSV